jgi:hypothetical protein
MLGNGILLGMNAQTIEIELTDVKNRLAKLESAAGTAPDKWRGAVGRIQPNELTKEAARLGEQWRKQENARR